MLNTEFRIHTNNYIATWGLGGGGGGVIETAAGTLTGLVEKMFCEVLTGTTDTLEGKVGVSDTWPDLLASKELVSMITSVGSFLPEIREMGYYLYLRCKN